MRGSSITLSCPYTTERSSLIIPTNITWIPPSLHSENTQIGRLLNLHENQLVIPNVQLVDGQTWKCIVANEYGSDSIDIEPDILGTTSQHLCVIYRFSFNFYILF